MYIWVVEGPRLKQSGWTVETGSDIVDAKRMFVSLLNHSATFLFFRICMQPYRLHLFRGPAATFRSLLNRLA